MWCWSVRARHLAPQRVRRPHVDEFAVAVGATGLGFHPVGFAGGLAPDDDDGARPVQGVTDLNLVLAQLSSA